MADSDGSASLRWRRFAAETTTALRERLERLTALSAEDRERLARRLHAAIASALEVPPDLKPRIEENAARLIARSGELDPVALAWERTRDRARRTAAIGAVTTVPALVPGIGTALAALGLVADWRYVAEQQRDLVLEIAALFGDWPDDPTTEARSLFLVATASAFASPAAGRFVGKVLAKQVARRNVARLLPGAGAAVAGALNYISTISIGRAAIAHFAQRAGVEVHGIVPVEISPAMPLLRNAVVEAIDAGANAQPFTEEATRAMSGLQPIERDELLDLAATLIAARDGNDATDRTLSELGLHLGFTADQIVEATERARRATLPARTRLRNAIQRAAEKGGQRVEWIWQRAARIARPRRGRKKPKRSRSRRPKP